jgi:hypothetical protein
MYHVRTSFLFISTNTPFYGYTTCCLTHPLVDGNLGFSTSKLIWRVPLGTFMYKHFCVDTFSVLLGLYLEVERNSMFTFFLLLIRETARLLSEVAVLFCSVRGFQLLYILPALVTVFLFDGKSFLCKWGDPFILCQPVSVHVLPPSTHLFCFLQ